VFSLKHHRIIGFHRLLHEHSRGIIRLQQVELDLAKSGTNQSMYSLLEMGTFWNTTRERCQSDSWKEGHEDSFCSAFWI